MFLLDSLNPRYEKAVLVDILQTEAIPLHSSYTVVKVDGGFHSQKVA